MLFFFKFIGLTFDNFDQKVTKSKFLLKSFQIWKLLCFLKKFQLTECSIKCSIKHSVECFQLVLSVDGRGNLWTAWFKTMICFWNGKETSTNNGYISFSVPPCLNLITAHHWRFLPKCGASQGPDGNVGDTCRPTTHVQWPPLHHPRIQTNIDE